MVRTYARIIPSCLGTSCAQPQHGSCRDVSLSLLLQLLLLRVRSIIDFERTMIFLMERRSSSSESDTSASFWESAAIKRERLALGRKALKSMLMH